MMEQTLDCHLKRGQREGREKMWNFPNNFPSFVRVSEQRIFLEDPVPASSAPRQRSPVHSLLPISKMMREVKKYQVIMTAHMLPTAAGPLTCGVKDAPLYLLGSDWGRWQSELPHMLQLSAPYQVALLDLYVVECETHPDYSGRIKRTSC